MSSQWYSERQTAHLPKEKKIDPKTKKKKKSDFGLLGLRKAKHICDPSKKK